MLLEKSLELPPIPALVGGHRRTRAIAPMGELGLGYVIPPLTCLHGSLVPSHLQHSRLASHLGFHTSFLTGPSNSKPKANHDPAYTLPGFPV